MPAKMTLPQNAIHYQLYANMPGAEGAAGEMITALDGITKRLRAELRTRKWQNRDPMWDDELFAGLLCRYYKEMWPIHNKHSKYGAEDPEPHSVTRMVLKRCVAVEFGLDRHEAYSIPL